VKTIEEYDSKKQWIGGEDIRVLVSDVLILGY